MRLADFTRGEERRIKPSRSAYIEPKACSYGLRDAQDLMDDYPIPDEVRINMERTVAALTPAQLDELVDETIKYALMSLDVEGTSHSEVQNQFGVVMNKILVWGREYGTIPEP